MQRRISVLKILGSTEAQISPISDKEKVQTAAQAEAEADNKRRRKSRVSFGNIQTAIFQKDSEWTADSSASPSITTTSGGLEFSKQGGGNLSTLPDDSAFGSPAGSEAMEMTGVVGANGDRLSLLPGLNDMGNDDSIASFSGEKSPGGALGPKSPAAAMSLADLVADDERQWGFRANNRSVECGDLLQRSGEVDAREDQTMAMEMTNVVGNGILSKGGEFRADVTDHDLTADIPGVGDRTRAFGGDRTGAFMEVTQAVTRKLGGDSEMEFTNVYGGIVRPAAVPGSRQSMGMELTTAYGGIVSRGGLEFGASGRESLITDPDAVNVRACLNRTPACPQDALSASDLCTATRP